MEADAGYCLFDTALGPCAVAWTASGITDLQIAEKTRAQTERHIRARSGAREAVPPPAVAEAILLVQRYLEGERIDFSAVRVDLPRASDFHRKLYLALRRIGWGKTTTYGGLGKMLDIPADARDIGQAMGKNPVPIIIPCHRVLAAGNRIGGFSAPGGTMTKEKLLALEGIHAGFSEDEPALPGLFG